MNQVLLIRCFQITLLFLGCIASALQAQSTDVVFERIKIPGGLDENRIHAIAQDHQGFMWLGTTGGLFRYDGYEFTRVDSDRLSPEDGYWGRHTWCLLVARSGELWICAGEKGVHRFDPQTDELVTFRHDPSDPNSLSSDTTRSAFEDRNGFLWVGSHTGVDRYNPRTGTFTAYRHDSIDVSSLSPGFVVDIYEDRTGVLWFATTEGLSRFDVDTESFIQYEADPDDEQKLINSDVRTLYEDSRGRFWVGTLGDGLHTMNRESGTFTRYRYDPEHPLKLSKPHISTWPAERTENLPVSDILEDRWGILWIGAHSGGLNLYDSISDRVTHYEASVTDPHSLANDMVWSLGQSEDGVVWVGTLARGGEGLHKAYRASPLVFHRLDSTSTGSVHAILRASSGDLWVGTERAGIFRFETGSEKGRHYRNVGDRGPNVSLRSVLAAEEGVDGTIWIGMWRRAFVRFDPSTNTFEQYAVTLRWFNESAGISAIRQTSLRDVWLGSPEVGLIHFDPVSGVMRYYQHDPNDPRSLSSDQVIINGIYQTANNALWIATKSGLNRFNQESKTFDRFFTSESKHGQIRSLTETGGQLWIGWIDGQLTRLDLDSDEIEHIDSRKAGFPGGELISMLADDNGDIWIRTDNAIARFDVSARRFYSYPMSRDAAQVGAGFGAFRDEDGQIYFGAAGGYHVFDPERMRAAENRIPPKVALTGLNIARERIQPGEDESLEQPLSLAEEIRLAHDQKDFSLDFVALHYLDPAKNRYAYMLEGYDDDWRDAGSERRASYYLVPPGTYTFRLKAANPFGIWSEEEASIRVVVLPPWWQSWWAYVLYVAGFGFLMFVGHNVRVARLKRKAEHLAEIVDERTAELRFEKARTEAQAKRLVELDEAKDRFFFNISHEFRTPLTLILGPIQDALSGVHGELAPTLRKSLLTMQRNGRRLHRLITQLLDLSKLEVGSMLLQARESDLVSFLKFTVLSLAPMAERRKVALKFRANIEELPVFFDADKLEHVITNLLSNALKFTSEQGKILVTVDEANEDGRSFALISVKDTGTGIPASELPYIFDRFHQSNVSRTRAQDGTGIGLALAKEIVELHHGTIEVESEEGFGTTFTIRLPLGGDHLMPDELAEEPDQETKSHSAYSEPSWLAEVQSTETTVSGNGAEALEGCPTILIVEDNGDVREYLKGHLTGLYRVIEAIDGTDGLQKAQENQPDLVLADVMMPGMDGFELCRTMKEDQQLEHIPVVLLTGMASEEAEVEGLEAGADDYICKPFSAEALLARVENLIEIRKLLRERFAGEVRIGASDVTVESAEAAFLEQVRTAVEAHLSDSSFTVEWLADEVGMSTRHLRRRLRELLKLSPGGFIRLVRLERAAQLLEQKAGNVSEVAYKVGFNDPRYFSRLFHQTFGTTPSSYPDE